MGVRYGPLGQSVAAVPAASKGGRLAFNQAIASSHREKIARSKTQKRWLWFKTWVNKVELLIGSVGGASERRIIFRLQRGRNRRIEIHEINRFGIKTGHQFDAVCTEPRVRGYTHGLFGKSGYSFQTSAANGNSLSSARASRQVG